MLLLDSNKIRSVNAHAGHSMQLTRNETETLKIY